MHMGPAKPGHKPQDALLGPICRRAMTSEQGNYLANLALYPGSRWPQSCCLTEVISQLAFIDGGKFIQSFTLVLCNLQWLHANRPFCFWM